MERKLSNTTEKAQARARYENSSSSEGLPNPNENSASTARRRVTPRGNGGNGSSVNSGVRRTDGAMRARQDSKRAMTSADNMDLFDNSDSSTVKPKKKRVWLRVIAGVMAVLVLGIGGLAVYRKVTYKPPVYVVQPIYENTGRFTLDNFKSAIVDFDTEKIQQNTVGESWLVKEVDYANQVEARLNFIKSVCAYVNFEYPTIQAVTNEGSPAVDSNGQAIMQEADMINGENFKVTIIDYDNLSATMKEDAVLIATMYQNSGYQSSDYTYRDDMVNLMIDYILSKPNLPTKTVEISLPVQEVEVEVTAPDGSVNKQIQYAVTDDGALDNLLFGSKEFHNMCDTFGTICWQFDNGALVGVNAPEQSAFADDSLVPIEELTESAVDDESVAESEDKKTDTSSEDKVESDDKKLDDTKTIESEVSSDTDSIINDVEVTTDETEPELPHNEEGYVYESVIPYTWVGAYFLANEYTGDLNPVAQEGDGTFELPAAVDTSVVTKALCADNNYHDVRVTLKGYWVGEDAVDYTIQFSEKNRGFDKNSSLQLICFEVEVENLEDNPITVQSELYLSDKQSNPSVRTGNVYGFLDSATIQPGESVVLQDWATSTELPTKYVCWGKSFKRSFPVIWFKLLAGSGDAVVDYNANTDYNNDSSDVSQSSNA